jgi:co-chaperonin GroES (HSP10)
LIGMEIKNRRILVDPDLDSGMAGRIAKPERAQDRPGSGKILAAALDAGPEFRVGCRVTFDSWAGREFRVGEVPYMLVHADEITSVSLGEVA